MTLLMNKTVLIMAGGTGGHVFPALAVAQEFIRRGASVHWLGTEKGIESRLVPEAKIPLHFLTVEGVRGKGFLGLLKAPALIARAIMQARAVIKKIKPVLVLGFGGFASGPGGMAATLLKVPLVIHEQNAVAGTTNRLLRKRANKVLSAFSGAFAKGGFNKELVVGNPVRESIQQLSNIESRFAGRSSEKIHLLILGGSLGAKAINELLPLALAKLNHDERPIVWHQTGKNHQEMTREIYAQHQVEGKVDAFIEDMAAAYAWADLVICRAGALTVSELMVAGVASIMIPLPTAIDDHQTANAKHLVDQGAGLSLIQKDLTAEKLADLIKEYSTDRNQLMWMAKKAQQIAVPDSAKRVVNICEKLVGEELVCE
jgi:UDP-N-acetylglucosamine--N-acetylmuramyl-(pentapeptide) pyrophosphoryl-undecaprenol N-acetylglucosamine transferase